MIDLDRLKQAYEKLIIPEDTPPLIMVGFGGNIYTVCEGKVERLINETDGVPATEEEIAALFEYLNGGKRADR